MLVEIAICTWNRAGLLAKTLSSLCQLQIPSGIQWKILLVDNNSSDGTAHVIDEFSMKLPLQRLREERQGHTYARNRAIEAATGELILWSDDDCQFNESWLANYVVAARDAQYDFWGATIEPLFESPMPDWIAENWELCKGCFAVRDLGARPIEFTPAILPYGANFAIRTSVQKSFLFDQTLGRNRHRVIGEDELEMMRRLLAAGYNGQWVPSNPVQHMIPSNRATTEYIYRYFVGQGMKLRHGLSTPRKNGLSLLLETVWNYLMFRLKRSRRPSPVWVSHLIQSALARGRYLAR